MSGNKLIGIEEILCGEDKYLFKADFNFTSSLEQNVDDPLMIYEEFSSGKCSPERIKGVMCCSVLSKNGNDIPNVEKEVEELITRNGLQDCLHLCSLILSYAIIGDVKKSELRKLKPSRLSQIITEPFKLENLRDRRLLWAYHLWISGACVCISFSLFVLLFAYNTDFARMVLTLM